jgi:hypothetical protein
MSRETHLAALAQRHEALDKEIERELLHPARDELKLSELKRRKLQLKDEIARLQCNRSMLSAQWITWLFDPLAVPGRSDRGDCALARAAVLAGGGAWTAFAGKVRNFLLRGMPSISGCAKTERVIWAVMARVADMR